MEKKMDGNNNISEELASAPSFDPVTTDTGELIGYETVENPALLSSQLPTTLIFRKLVRLLKKNMMPSSWTKCQTRFRRLGRACR